MSQSNQALHESEATDSDKLTVEDRDEKFRIHNPIDILFILRGMMKSRTLITLYFDQNNSFILSSVLAVDPEIKQIIIDYGCDKKLNRKALDARNLTIMTAQAEVEIKFTCDSVKKVQFEGNDAFLVDLPESLVRLQRREFFRISIPKINPLKCIVPLSDSYDSDTAEVTISDISCGGIGILDDHSILHVDRETIFKDCKITLPEIGTITTTIQIKSTFEVTLRNGLMSKRVGCKFAELLPAKKLAMIQRYMAKLERMQRQARDN
ncbi:MAG: flagellar brake protein [Nitrosomonas sp.]|nr:flagellar brake protein [Nitrosomonas sp.]MDP1950562.1 flagellar brake protein [Nitrosomonas sp.]